MPIKPLTLIFALFTLLCGHAYAEEQNLCTPEVETALRAVDPKLPVDVAVVDSDCKLWPPSGGKVMAAVMAFESGDKNEQYPSWVVVIALLDAQSHQLHQSLNVVAESDALTEIRRGSLMLDTARYMVQPKLRALGLRFQSAARGASAPDARWSDELILLVPKGKTLQRVFGVAMSAQSALVGCVSMMCKGSIWQDASLTVAVGPTAPNGWNELIVNETLTLVREDNDLTKLDADGKNARQHRYRYDGKAYRRVSAGEPFWDMFCCLLQW